MKAYPSIPPVADAPAALLERGHLWIQELIDGALLRFAVDASGWLVFGDRERVYRDDAVAPRHRHAVRHVRETIDRDVLRQSGDALSDAVFFGAATGHRRIEYDWERTPSFLGFDVWDGNRGRFLPPDAAERAFERLSLHPLDAFEKERPARHFDPDSYAIPDSRWYDGPPAGVVLRNKRGDRATLSTPGFDPHVREPDADPVTVAERATTPERIEAAIAALGASGDPPAYDAVVRRTVERVLREAYGHIDAAGRVDADAVTDAIRARTRTYLAEERPDVGSGG